MNIKRTVISLLLVAGLAAGACNTKKVNVDPNQPKPTTADNILKAGKNFGLAAADALDEAIPFEAALAEQGLIDKDIEPVVRRELLNAQIALKDFNARAATYTSFDSTSDADLKKLRDDTLAFVERMTATGVAHIKSPKSQLIAQSIISGVRLALRAYDRQRAQLGTP